MKRLFTLIISLVLILTVFAGCGADKSHFPEDTTCDDIRKAIVNVTKEPDYFTAYTLKEPLFNAFSMSLWADGLHQSCPEYELIEECYIFLADGNDSYEFGIIKTANEADAEKIRNVFERRKAIMADGNKAAYDPDFEDFYEDSEIYTDGDFTIFLMTEDNKAAKEAINKLKVQE